MNHGSQGKKTLTQNLYITMPIVYPSKTDLFLRIKISSFWFKKSKFTEKHKNKIKNPPFTKKKYPLLQIPPIKIYTIPRGLEFLGSPEK